MLIDVQCLDVVNLDLNSIAIFIDFNQNLLWLGHVIQDRFPQLIHDVRINLAVHETALKESLGTMRSISIAVHQIPVAVPI